MKIFMDICVGDRALQDKQQAHYDATNEYLSQVHHQVCGILMFKYTSDGDGLII